MTMNYRPRFSSCPRRGNIAVLAVFLLIGMIALLAFALDLGVVFTMRSALQRSADAAAMAGAWRLLEEQGDLDDTPRETEVARTQETITRYVGLNPVGRRELSLATDDVEIGHLDVLYDRTKAIDVASPEPFNAVSVRVQRTDAVNGAIPLFFARALGRDRLGQIGEATAAFWCSFQGFQMPSDGSNLGIIPITMDEGSWLTLVEQLENHGGEDNYRWDEDSKSLVPGTDGIPEGNLYPEDVGEPGNRGTVDIGSSGNSTADLVRQILDGITAADLAHHGGELRLDANGELFLNGDTGISASLKAPLDEIKGQPRVIPIFREVNGNGNNAMYTIVGFAGIRIMNVKLTGSLNSKKVIVQPSCVTMGGGIPYTDGGQSPTHFIYSPVVLVR